VTLAALATTINILFSAKWPSDLKFNLLIPSELVVGTLWPIFFFALYREHSGSHSRLSSRRAACLLAVAISMNAIAAHIVSNFVYFSVVRFIILELTPIAAWLVFLAAFALDPEKPRVGRIALVLAVIVVAGGLFGSRTTFLAALRLLAPAHDYKDALTGSYRLLWRYHPLSAAWQVGVGMGLPIAVWLSEVLFLLLFWKTPMERTISKRIALRDRRTLWRRGRPKA
jgi:hypothetical protein